jgi:hypothetical protein
MSQFNVEAEVRGRSTAGFKLTPAGELGRVPLT